MQVKDYLQALSDDNKIRIEKMGSGNWYWSSPRDEKKAKETAVGKAENEYTRANAIAMELQAKIDEAGAACKAGEDILTGRGNASRPPYCPCHVLSFASGDRKTLIAKLYNLTKELENLW